MARRLRTYLYPYKALSISIPESELGTGKTLTAKFCSAPEGDPSDIGSLTQTATATGGSYDIDFTRAALLADLADQNKKAVYLHLDDGAAWHDVYEFVVTNVPPELLTDLT